MTLGELLRSRGLPASAMLAIRNDLDPALVCDDYTSIAHLDRLEILHLYDRMQDGPKIRHDARVLSFMALPDHRARLTADRRFMMRRPGVAPGDIVYDAEAAHLLHAFIAHAANPVFYDAIDEDGLGDLIGRLEIRWPEDKAGDLRPADDPHMIVAER